MPITPGSDDPAKWSTKTNPALEALVTTRRQEAEFHLLPTRIRWTDGRRLCHKRESKQIGNHPHPGRLGR